MREAWTDERLDDLNSKVDRGFDRMDSRFDRMEERVERTEERFDARFDSLQRTLVQGGIVVIAALTGLIATQL